MRWQHAGDALYSDMNSDMKTKKEISSNVSYRVLIRYKNQLRNVGTCCIKTRAGDIYYSPSSRYLIENNQSKLIEHFSFHVSGAVHVKLKYKTPEYLTFYTADQRQGMAKVGFQELMRDIIVDTLSLPTVTSIRRLDVVFDVGEYGEPVSFSLFVVSGQLIVTALEYGGVGVTAVQKPDTVLGIDTRALGRHSGHGDIILQYTLRKTGGVDLPTERRIFFPADSGISKPRPTSKNNAERAVC